MKIQQKKNNNPSKKKKQNLKEKKMNERNLREWHRERNWRQDLMRVVI